jgi:hypothetical protein
VDALARHRGVARNIVQSKTEQDPARALRLLAQMQASDQLIPDLDDAPFQPLEDDERRVEQGDAGKRYYPYDEKQLVALPTRADLRPSRSALEWHNDKVFRRAG